MIRFWGLLKEFKLASRLPLAQYGFSKLVHKPSEFRLQRERHCWRNQLTNLLDAISLLS